MVVDYFLLLFLSGVFFKGFSTWFLCVKLLIDYEGLTSWLVYEYERGFIFIQPNVTFDLSEIFCLVFHPFLAFYCPSHSLGLKCDTFWSPTDVGPDDESSESSVVSRRGDFPDV